MPAASPHVCGIAALFSLQPDAPRRRRPCKSGCRWTQAAIRAGSSRATPCTAWSTPDAYPAMMPYSRFLLMPSGRASFCRRRIFSPHIFAAFSSHCTDAFLIAARCSPGRRPHEVSVASKPRLPRMWPSAPARLFVLASPSQLPSLHDRTAVPYFARTKVRKLHNVSTHLNLSPNASRILKASL